MALNTETIHVNMVVDIPYGFKKEDVEVKLGKFLSTYGANWFYVYHDKDINDKGLPKTPHFHVLFDSLDGKKHRIKYYLRRLQEVVGNRDLSPYSGTTWNNYEGDIQYLIHKNNPEKFQYDISEVKASNLDDLASAMSVNIEPELTTARIIAICEECESLTEVFLVLGLNKANHYFKVVSMIWRDVAGCPAGSFRRTVVSKRARERLREDDEQNTNV